MTTTNQKCAKHQEVRQDVQDGSKANVNGQATTFIFYHIPQKYTKHDVLSVLEQRTARRNVDFVYVPWRANASHNVGFALVNFVELPIACKLVAEMQGSVWPTDEKPRRVKIMPALVQGRLANLLNYIDNVGDMELTHCPLIFYEGSEIPLHIAVEQARQSGVQESSQWLPAYVPPTPSAETRVEGISSATTTSGSTEWSRLVSTNTETERSITIDAELPPQPTNLESSYILCGDAMPSLGSGASLSEVDELADSGVAQGSLGYQASQVEVCSLLQKLRQAGAF